MYGLSCVDCSAVRSDRFCIHIAARIPRSLTHCSVLFSCSRMKWGFGYRTDVPALFSTQFSLWLLLLSVSSLSQPNVPALALNLLWPPHVFDPLLPVPVSQANGVRSWRALVTAASWGGGQALMVTPWKNVKQSLLPARSLARSCWPAPGFTTCPGRIWDCARRWHQRDLLGELQHWHGDPCVQDQRAQLG